jgi:hypothetical protein
VNLALAELRLAPNVLQESADPAVVAAVVAGLLSSLDDVDLARLALRQPELRELVERVWPVRAVHPVEVRVAGVTCDRAPRARVLHTVHDRAVAARRLAEAAAVLARRERAELLVDERHELARQVIRVAADRRRVHVLIAAERGEAIGERDDDRPHLALVHETGRALGHVLLEAARRRVHAASASEADEVVDDGEARAAAAALRLVVLRRQPDVE